MDDFFRRYTLQLKAILRLVSVVNSVLFFQLQLQVGGSKVIHQRIPLQKRYVFVQSEIHDHKVPTETILHTTLQAFNPWRS